MKASKIADEFSITIGVTPPRTNLRLAQQTVTRLYTSAAAEFGSVVVKAASKTPVKPVSHEKLEDDLAAWLENTHIHDGDHDDEPRGLHPKVNTSSVALYRCSWCGNPSAVLRKCSKSSSFTNSQVCFANFFYLRLQVVDVQNLGRVISFSV